MDTMRTQWTRMLTGVLAIAVLAIAVLAAAPLAAQAPAQDPSARLRSVLPADVAERVLARIDAARSRELPPQAVAALENRALKYAARGVAAADVERAIGEHADRMLSARDAIESARTAKAEGDEIDAGAEAMRQGVDGASVSELAKSAPSGRSLAVPLFVVGNLVARGLPADDALAQVRDRLTARATDRELERLAGAPGRGRGDEMGAGMRPADRPGAAGRPTEIPARTGRRPEPAPTRRP